MRQIKFLAGVGTVFVFIAIFCFKAAFGKQPVKKGKGWLIFFGSLSFLLGAALIILAITKIST